VKLLKKFRITESSLTINLDNVQKVAHYVECNICEQISPFAIKIENTFTIVFNGEILKVEKC